MQGVLLQITSRGKQSSSITIFLFPLGTPNDILHYSHGIILMVLILLNHQKTIG